MQEIAYAPKPDPVAYARAARCVRFRYHAQDWLGIVKPLKLRIGLTNRCNARCIMCNIWKQRGQHRALPAPLKSRPDELDTDLSSATVALFSNLEHISLTGGEPTLRRDFVQIWRVLHEQLPPTSQRESFNSNGFSAAQKLWRMWEEILSFHPRLTVMISLDGMGESRDRVRGLETCLRAHRLATIEGVAALRPRTILISSWKSITCLRPTMWMTAWSCSASVANARSPSIRFTACKVSSTSMRKKTTSRLRKTPASVTSSTFATS